MALARSFAPPIWASMRWSQWTVVGTDTVGIPEDMNWRMAICWGLVRIVWKGGGTYLSCSILTGDTLFIIRIRIKGDRMTHIRS